MTVMSAFNKVHTRIRESIDGQGAIAVGVNFRNSFGAGGPQPFLQV